LLQAAEIDNVTEQWKDLKFCKRSSETFQMIMQACDEEALGRCAAFEWHKRFAQNRAG
jgi:hypothetical protein